MGWRGALGLGFVWGNVAAVFVADALRASAEIYFLQSPLVSWLFTAGVYSLTSAVYYAAFGVMYRGLAARPGPALPLLAAAAWVTAELARARLLTGSGFWGNPWALLGYSQVGVDPPMQVASLGGIFVVSFVMLGFFGTQPATPTFTMFARIFTVLYFLFFLLMPIYSKMDKTKPVPERVSK